MSSALVPHPHLPILELIQLLVPTHSEHFPSFRLDTLLLPHGLPFSVLHLYCLASPHLEVLRNFSVPCTSVFQKLYSFDLVISLRILREQRLFMIKDIQCITFGTKGVCACMHVCTHVCILKCQTYRKVKLARIVQNFHIPFTKIPHMLTFYHICFILFSLSHSYTHTFFILLTPKYFGLQCLFSKNRDISYITLVQLSKSRNYLYYNIIV